MESLNSPLRYTWDPSIRDLALVLSAQVERRNLSLHGADVADMEAPAGLVALLCSSLLLILLVAACYHHPHTRHTAVPQLIMVQGAVPAQAMARVTPSSLLNLGYQITSSPHLSHTQNQDHYLYSWDFPQTFFSSLRAGIACKMSLFKGNKHFFLQRLTAFGESIPDCVEVLSTYF